MGELSRIPTDVDGLRDKLREVLKDIDDGSLLALLESTRTIVGDRAKVVFAGEMNTGKSSLINALLNRTDLLPVGAAGPTTATYTAISYGTAESLRVELRDGQIATGDLTAIGGYTSFQGAQSNEILRATVLVDEPVLATLSLVDTPGISNPDTAFGRLTLDALTDATVLVFVCTAGSKISTAERDFIVETARRIDRIIFVLNRIDEHHQWRDSLRENEETVRADQKRFPDPRFANVVFLPVSARKALQPALRERSGIDGLWEQLRSCADQHHELAKRNELRVLRSMISDVQAMLALRWNALGAETSTEAAAFDGQLKALSIQDKAWRSALKSEVTIARGEVQRLVELHRMDLRTDYQARIGQQTSTSADVETSLIADLSGMHLQAIKCVGEHAVEIARRLLTGLPGTESAVEMIDVQMPDPSTSISAYIRERPPRPDNPMEKFTDMQTTFLGWSMSSGAAGVALAAMSITGAPVVLVGAAIGVPGALLWRRWAKQVRERSAEASHTKSWVEDQIAHATKLVDREINQAFTNAEKELYKALEKAFADAKNELESLRQIHSAGRESVDEERRRIRDRQRRLVEAAHGCDTQLRAVATPSS